MNVDATTYLSGRRLYGDDFDDDELRAWFADEREGYAGLGRPDLSTYRYGYSALNQFHGFRHLPKRQYSHVLGLGSAFGHELLPVARSANRITIVEPSDAFVHDELNGVPLSYVKPDPLGVLPFPDNTFDLVTSFGTLHHVANVSTVLGEMVRCAEPGGYLLIREPTVSLGDWRQPRAGLTKRERGIPLHIFKAMVRKAGLEVIREDRCVFPLMSRIARIIGRGAYTDQYLVLVDQLLSWCFSWNTIYHPYATWQKLRPTALFVVARKPGL